MKRIVIWLLAVVLPAGHSVANAQQSTRIPKIGFLSAALVEPFRDAFREGLRERGYVEGQNIAIEWRHSDGKVERLPALAAELARSKMAVIVTGGTPAFLAARDATSTIPVVLCIGDPVREGFVAGLARPGGNVTGVTSVSTDLAGKRLQLLKETVPRLTRAGVLWDGRDQGTAANFTDTEAAARALEVQVKSLEVRSPEDFDSAFKAATGARAHGLVVLPGALISPHRIRIAELAIKNRLPTIFADGRHVESGGLMSYAPSYPEMFRRVAVYVDKILKGAKAADLPVEQPTKFELIINLKTAKQIGLTIPPEVLMRADKVIK